MSAPDGPRGGPGEGPGAPPAEGLAVRPTDQGFHARIWPRPPVPWGRVAVGATAFGAAGVGVAALTTADAGAGVAVVLGILLFGALLGVGATAPGFLPVELELDDATVYWNGDRIPLAAVRGARAHGGRLALLGEAGELAALDHLRPEVATWLAAAVRASVPAEPT